MILFVNLILTAEPMYATKFPLDPPHSQASNATNAFPKPNVLPVTAPRIVTCGFMKTPIPSANSSGIVLGGHPSHRSHPFGSPSWKRGLAASWTRGMAFRQPASAPY
jgi:hypothetical protein